MLLSVKMQNGGGTHFTYIHICINRVLDDTYTLRTHTETRTVKYFPIYTYTPHYIGTSIAYIYIKNWNDMVALVATSQCMNWTDNFDRDQQHRGIFLCRVFTSFLAIGIYLFGFYCFASIEFDFDLQQGKKITTSNLVNARIARESRVQRKIKKRNCTTRVRTNCSISRNIISRCIYSVSFKLIVTCPPPPCRLNGVFSVLLLLVTTHTIWIHPNK